MKVWPLLVLGIVLVGCGGGGNRSAATRATFDTFSLEPLTTNAQGISSDGRIVLGSSFMDDDPGTPRFWAASGASGVFAGSDSLTPGFVAASTRDSSHFLGTAMRNDGTFCPAFLTLVTPPQALPLPTGASNAFGVDVSDDGKVALCENAVPTTLDPVKPYLVKDGVATYLPLPEGANIVRVKAISGDGRTVVGSIDKRAVRWIDGGAPESLGGEADEAVAVSRDGSVIVGTSIEADGMSLYGSRRVPYRWTARQGVQTLTLPSGAQGAVALGVSADGKTVLLNVSAPNSSVERAALWKDGSGVRMVSDLFAKAGGDRSAFTDVEATALSADGKTIVGSVYTGQEPSLSDSNDTLHISAWKLTLP